MAAGIARSRLFDQHLAEDAAQEAFAVACQRLSSLRDTNRFPEWLGTICRRTASRMARSQNKGAPIEHEPVSLTDKDDSAVAQVRQAWSGFPDPRERSFNCITSADCPTTKSPGFLGSRPRRFMDGFKGPVAYSHVGFLRPRKGVLPMNKSHECELEEQLRKVLGSPGKADFEGWRNRHGDALAYLNPVVTKLYQRRRRILMRITSVTVAALLIVAVVSLFFVPQQASFAQAVKAINKAETITYTQTSYWREYSMDGKRTWLHKSRRDFAYKAPNQYRVTSYDKDGNVRWVDIVDNMSNKTLNLDMKSKKATWGAQPSHFHFGPGSPLGWVANTLESKPIELVGQREVNGVNVNVFRSHREFSHSSFDIWLDARTKRLVGFSDPGADYFDPTTATDRDNPAEERASKGGEPLVSIGSDIVFDAQLDAKLFSLAPPEGFEVVQEPPHPPVTESQLIEWLGVTARFNNGRFVDTVLGTDLHEKQNEARGRTRRIAPTRNRDISISGAST